jgi:hypothetical protein
MNLIDTFSTPAYAEATGTNNYVYSRACAACVYVQVLPRTTMFSLAQTLLFMFHR